MLISQGLDMRWRRNRHSVDVDMDYEDTMSALSFTVLLLTHCQHGHGLRGHNNDYADIVYKFCRAFLQTLKNQ